MTAFGNELIML